MKPKFVITMLDGEKIKVFNDTLIVGYDDASNIEEENGMFYSSEIYVNTLQSDIGVSSLATAKPLVGLIGFLSKATFFSLGDNNIDSEEVVIYKTSAVKNIGFK